LIEAINSTWPAVSSGRLEEAARFRDRAYALLQKAAADNPGFAGWAQQIAASYRDAGFGSKGRAVLQEALGRTARQGEATTGNAALLGALGDAWQREANLLTALGYLERAAAAEAAAPPPVPPAKGTRGVFISGAYSYQPITGAIPMAAVSRYNQLADLYRRLGRPDAAAAVQTRIQALLAGDPMSLARSYEQQGKFDEAAAIYRKFAESASDPWISAMALQALAMLDARQQQWGDAVDAMEKAIAAAQSSDKQAVRNQTLWMRNNLAGYLKSAGKPDQADQLMQQLIQDTQGQPEETQVLFMYSEYLMGSNRGTQADNVLQQYLTNHPNLPPGQRSGVYSQLANVAMRSGNQKQGAEYQKQAQALRPPQESGGASGEGPDLRPTIADDLQKADAAANQRRMDEAYDLAVRAVDMAPQAKDGQQAGWRIPQIARQLVSGGEPAKAEKLFQRVIAMEQNVSAYNQQRLILVRQNYARFLMEQKERVNDVPAAIDAYAGALAAANGSDSGTTLEAVRLRLEFARRQAKWDAADALIRQLLEQQESLSGNTSEPYLTDLQTGARTYEGAGDWGRALPLRRKAMTIADLLAGPLVTDNWRRAQTAIETALVLAHLEQFEEAERLLDAGEALRANASKPSGNQSMERQQIRKLKEAAAARSRANQ
jgi:tetratricopeptide (TPR) repeat protein